MTDLKPIAETDNFIILDKYTKIEQKGGGYQTEADLERELIQDLIHQGYEFLPDLKNPEALLKNVRIQLQELNKVQFLDSEWLRFVEEYLDKPNNNNIDKTRKIHNDYIYDFVFDDGHIQNIYLLDKKNIVRNKVQVIQQFEQTGTQAKWKIENTNLTKKWCTTNGGGYIWHTTGSGKTLTSFKAARMATELDFIDKVFFVVDRKDLDFQTIMLYLKLISVLKVISFRIIIATFPTGLRNKKLI